MRIEFKVDQREIDKLMRDLSAYGGRVAKKIEKETGYAALEVQQLAAKKAPHNLGRLGGSIQVQRQARSVKLSRRLRGQAARVTYKSVRLYDMRPLLSSGAFPIGRLSDR